MQTSRVIPSIMLQNDSYTTVKLWKILFPILLNSMMYDKNYTMRIRQTGDCAQLEKGNMLLC